eukprot:scaffold8918_cov59-Phaeocystis_antarctica.AAC.8
MGRVGPAPAVNSQVRPEVVHDHEQHVARMSGATRHLLALPNVLLHLRLKAGARARVGAPAAEAAAGVAQAAAQAMADVPGRSTVAFAAPASNMRARSLLCHSTAFPGCLYLHVRRKVGAGWIDSTSWVRSTSCLPTPCPSASAASTHSSDSTHLSTARFLSANAPGRVRTVVARLVREGVALNRQPAATPCPWRPFSDRARRCPGVDDFPGRSAASKHSALGRSVKFCKFHVRSLFVSRERERGVDRTTAVRTVPDDMTMKTTHEVGQSRHNDTSRHGDTRRPTSARTPGAGRRKHPRAGPPRLRAKPRAWAWFGLSRRRSRPRPWCVLAWRSASRPCPCARSASCAPELARSAACAPGPSPLPWLSPRVKVRAGVGARVGDRVRAGVRIGVRVRFGIGVRVRARVKAPSPPAWRAARSAWSCASPACPCTWC